MISNSSDFFRIQNLLKVVKAQALLFRNHLQLANISITTSEVFFNHIVNRLSVLGFRVILTNKLKSYKHYGHIPSITFFNSYNKQQGGLIYIYSGYSKRKRLELLMHEFIHIHDLFIPTLSTSRYNINNMLMLSEQMLEFVEERTELISLALMMPIDQFQYDLFHYSYNINEIVDLYGAIKTSSIIKWIVLHDYFHAHYSLLYFRKDKGKEITYKIDEYCSDNNMFDINNILSNSNSIAHNCRKNKKSISGESDIDNKWYQCFCFYEENVQQSFPLSVSPLKEVVPCDEMAIIGWLKDTYKYMEKLDFKPKS